MDLTPGVMHASAVAFGSKGVLLVGPSGSGKSSLALHLIGLGADLVADDRVELSESGTALEIGAPAGAPALIEARGVGLLRTHLRPSARLSLVVDMGTEEDNRLPPLLYAVCEGVSVPLFHNVTNPTFPVAIRQYLLNGRHDPDG